MEKQILYLSNILPRTVYNLKLPWIVCENLGVLNSFAAVKRSNNNLPDKLHTESIMFNWLQGVPYYQSERCLNLA